MIHSLLGVRVTSYNGDRYLDVDDLDYSLTDRGGYDAATFTFPGWVTLENGVLVDDARVRIYSDATGEVLWEGYLSIPGTQVEEAGQTWQLSAVGAKAVLNDSSKPYVAVDSSYDGWKRRNNSSPGSTAEEGSLPTDDDTDALVMQFIAGQPIDNTSRVAMRYTRIRNAGQKVGGYGFDVLSGINNVNFEAQTVIQPSGNVVNTFPASTTPGHISSSAGTTGWATTDDDALTLRWRRVSGGATNVVTDDNWGGFYNLWVRSQLRLQDGTYLTGSFTYFDDNFLLAHQLVIDMLWWFTNMIDIEGADIDTSFTHEVDQWVYPDGVRMSNALEDLTKFEPDMTWKVGPSDSVTGKHSFVLSKYTDTVRYYATTLDGWDAPGSESRSANKLRVFWTDRRGEDHVDEYTADPADTPGLTWLGRERDAEEIHLSEELGSQAAADRIGTAFLAQLNTNLGAGTLTIARKVYDALWQRWVDPSEIEPGYLTQITDLLIDPMRMTEYSYSDSDLAGTATLGNPIYTDEELAAKETRRRNRRGGAKTALTYT